MRNMQVITQQQAQRVLARRKRQFGRRAGIAKMNMVRIRRYWQSDVRYIRIDKQVMMA